MIKSIASQNFLARILPLALLMLGTRYYHIGSAWHLPDASWAVFFLGGFYLQRNWFALLLAEALVIDFAFFAAGGSAYCLSAAYWVLLPAYGALWFAGAMLARQSQHNARFFTVALAYWWVSASLAYALTNGSFYWLSGKAIEPSWSNYWQHASIWYSAFVTRPMLYLGVAALLHFIAVQARRLRVAV